jgi:hypothetical protein
VTDELPPDNQQFEQVLTRLDALMKRGQSAPTSDIPVLTDIYQGTDAQQLAQAINDLPLAGEVTDDVAKPSHAELVESLMADLAPLIENAVEIAVLHQLAELELSLRAKLQVEIKQALRERLLPISDNT